MHIKTTLLATVLACVACGSESDWDYDSDSDSDSGSDSNAPTMVCVYKASSRVACSDYSNSEPAEWDCSTLARDLTTCESTYATNTDCDGSCCYSYSYYQHYMFEGTCAEALNPSSSSDSSDSDSSNDEEDQECNPDACATVCLNADYTAHTNRCNDSGTCMCTSASCGGCAESCLEAGYSGFSGICDPGESCYCSDLCGNCEEVCTNGGYSGFSGTCTSESCYCSN